MSDLLNAVNLFGLVLVGGVVVGLFLAAPWERRLSRDWESMHGDMSETATRAIDAARMWQQMYHEAEARTIEHRRRN